MAQRGAHRLHSASATLSILSLRQALYTRRPGASHRQIQCHRAGTPSDVLARQTGCQHPLVPHDTSYDTTANTAWLRERRNVKGEAPTQNGFMHDEATSPLLQFIPRRTVEHHSTHSSSCLQSFPLSPIGTFSTVAPTKGARSRLHPLIQRLLPAAYWGLVRLGSLTSQACNLTTTQG